LKMLSPNSSAVKRKIPQAGHGATLNIGVK